MEMKHEEQFKSMSEEKDQLLVALDVGSSKVVGIVAEYLNDKGLELRSIRSLDSSLYMKQGMITNFAQLQKGINALIGEMERDANCTIHSVTTSLSNRLIRSERNDGLVALNRKVVNRQELEEVQRIAGCLEVEEDERVLNVLPIAYTIDQQRGIKNPIGMSGMRLEVLSHLVIADGNSVDNLQNCIKEHGPAVDYIIYDGISSSVAVTSEEERQSNVCVIDIGAGLTDLVVYRDGSVVYTISLPIAGDQVTDDIAKVLKLTLSVAERLKLTHGSCVPDTIGADEKVELPSLAEGVKGQQVGHQILCHVMQARYEELFNFVLHLLKREGIDFTQGAGIVLTGGGAQAKDLLPLAKQLFKGARVRIGVPLKEQISWATSETHSQVMEQFDSPKFATVMGLLLAPRRLDFWQEKMYSPKPKEGWMKRFLNRAKKQF